MGQYLTVNATVVVKIPTRNIVVILFPSFDEKKNCDIENSAESGERKCFNGNGVI